MLACIPTNNGNGLDDTVCEHFGSATYFTLYDSSTDEVQVIRNRNAHHGHGTCHPVNQLAKYHIDSIICSGMGRRAIEALTSEGIKVYHADSETVKGVTEQIKQDDLTEIDPLKACRGHGQHAGFIHGPGQSRQFGRGQGQGAGRRQRRQLNQGEGGGSRNRNRGN